MLAAAQRDVKRMLAYSSVAHAGFILAGLTSPNMIGIRAAMFYLIAYTVMTVGAFGVTMVVAVKTDEPSSYDSYDGLAARSPGLAALLTIFLLSLAGIPPTVGFIAKVTVFGSAIRAGNWPLVVVCVLASVIAAYAYLRVIVRMYFRAPQLAIDDDRSVVPQAAGLVLAVSVLVLGRVPAACCRHHRPGVDLEVVRRCEGDPGLDAMDEALEAEIRGRLDGVEDALNKAVEADSDVLGTTASATCSRPAASGSGRCSSCWRATSATRPTPG